MDELDIIILHIAQFLSDVVKPVDRSDEHVDVARVIEVQLAAGMLRSHHRSQRVPEYTDCTALYHDLEPTTA